METSSLLFRVAGVYTQSSRMFLLNEKNYGLVRRGRGRKLVPDNAQAKQVGQVYVDCGSVALSDIES